MSCGRAESTAPRRLLLLLAVLLALTVTETDARRHRRDRVIDCRVTVYHHKCRGVSGHHSRNHLHGLGRLMATYLSRATEAKKLRALNRFLSPNRAHPVSDERRADLLGRLLSMDRSRTPSDYSDADYSESDYSDDYYDADV